MHKPLIICIYVLNLQESVLRCLSQRFRNIRRYSEHVQAVTAISKVSLNNSDDNTSHNITTVTEDDEKK